MSLLTSYLMTAVNGELDEREFPVRHVFTLVQKKLGPGEFALGGESLGNDTRHSAHILSPCHQLLDRGNKLWEITDDCRYI